MSKITSEKIITEEKLETFKENLLKNERAQATIEKYLRDIRKIKSFANGREITKGLMLAYKEHLIQANYEPASINSFLVAANTFFEFLEWNDCTVKLLKIQRDSFADEQREMTREEYERLVSTAVAAGNMRLALVMGTICATGIRVSELEYLTVESVRRKKMFVTNKGKTRTVILTDELCSYLTKYIRENQIKSGPVLCTASGRPLDRSNVWREMKALCRKAGVEAKKVFPHNLRHLFARLFHAVCKDIAKLADILGHSSIETTRIYLRTTTKEYVGTLNRMSVLHGLF